MLFHCCLETWFVGRFYAYRLFVIGLDCSFICRKSMVYTGFWQIEVFNSVNKTYWSWWNKGNSWWWIISLPTWRNQLWNKFHVGNECGLNDSHMSCSPSPPLYKRVSSLFPLNNFDDSGITRWIKSLLTMWKSNLLIK